MSTDVVVDADVVEEPAIASAQEAVSTELVRRERRSEVLRPLDPETLLQSFEEYQGLLQRLLTPDDWQGPPNRPGSFVKKKGWRKIATAFDLDVTVIPGMSKIERDENGLPVRAEVWMRAIAPSGRTMDGDGYCSVTEPRFAQASGRQKLENDLRATATTRAKNRAISDLIGMGDVSAEEVDATPQSSDPPYGTPASNQQGTQARTAIGFLLGVEEQHTSVDDVFRQLKDDADGYFPRISLVATIRCAQAVKARREADRPATEEEIEAATKLASEVKAAGTVTPPVLSGQSMEADLKLLRDAGCICPDPYTQDRSGIDSACPLRGHGIPFDEAPNE